ncbi:hypothetical protein [Microcoleus sp. B4-C1]|uniref:hypothetical protein n=1 Tax=Microcoleus sp. B4-C1 TaxID=2818660 RepID=UPI002FD3CE32
MIQADLETELETFRLRDAFRILAWNTYEINRKYTELDQVYTQFYTRWSKCQIRSMDLAQLTELATERGFTIEGLLFYRECYYGIAQPYPPEVFLSND